MFLVMVTYKKPLTVVDQHLAAHRDYLEEGYKKNYFIVSGPRNPRTGGIILSQLKDREKLMEVISQDPFKKLDIADFDVIEFNPVKYHDQFVEFIK